MTSASKPDPPERKLIGRMYRERATGDVIRLIAYDSTIDRYECEVWSAMAEPGEKVRCSINPTDLWDRFRFMGWLARLRFRRGPAAS